MSVRASHDFLPYFAQGTVVKGFGRGSSELGIPTANFTEDVIRQLPDAFACGVYYGWACVNTLTPPTVHKMVMCVGWNPHYQNTVKTMETHIMHKFETNFYGENLRIIVMGFIRPMSAFKSLGRRLIRLILLPQPTADSFPVSWFRTRHNPAICNALIAAMNDDIRFSESTLQQPPNSEFSHHPFLTSDEIKCSVHSSLDVPSPTGAALTKQLLNNEVGSCDNENCIEKGENYSLSHVNGDISNDKEGDDGVHDKSDIHDSSIKYLSSHSKIVNSNMNAMSNNSTQSTSSELSVSS